MIPESKCAFLEIFTDPLADHGVKSELNNAGHSCILGCDFSVISFLVTRAMKIIQFLLVLQTLTAVSSIWGTSHVLVP
jgi:hypothetical protein